LILNGGEYRNRTDLHGFAIQKEVKRKQRFRVSKYPLTNREQNAKVSNSLSPFQNKKDPVTVATVNRGLLQKAWQLSESHSTILGGIAIARSVFVVSVDGEVTR
jgi:putative heme degradation protein